MNNEQITTNIPGDEGVGFASLEVVGDKIVVRFDKELSWIALTLEESFVLIRQLMRMQLLLPSMGKVVPS